MLMMQVAKAIDFFVEILVLLIIIRAVLSFFPQIDRHHPLVRTLDQVVDPILRPFQRLLPPMSGLDFSPIIAILTIQLVGGLVVRLVANLAFGG